MMNDIDICRALLNGNHLNDDELGKAHKLVWLFKRAVRERISELNKRDGERATPFMANWSERPSVGAKT